MTPFLAVPTNYPEWVLRNLLWILFLLGGDQHLDGGAGDDSLDGGLVNTPQWVA